MNIREIIKQYLEQNGYDGLCDESGECGCYVEDLFICHGSFNWNEVSTCKPGYLHKNEDGSYGIGEYRPEEK